jgi:hypothetical protein
MLIAVPFLGASLLVTLVSSFMIFTQLSITNWTDY